VLGARHKNTFGFMNGAFMFFSVLKKMWNAFHYFFTFLTGLAVLAACLKFLAVGAPFAPAFRMVSPDPALILFFLA